MPHLDTLEADVAQQAIEPNLKEQVGLLQKRKNHTCELPYQHLCNLHDKRLVAQAQCSGPATVPHKTCIASKQDCWQKRQSE